ncbi:hypothetical protein BJ912DRAFT_1109343 [Pholiota molesta]|nr:hypothetical protein BJ912DRAFT_1109343 [Pholiota molesta]
MGCRIWTDDGGAHCRRSLISAAQLRLSLHYISSGFSLSLLPPPTPTAMDAPPLPTATPTITALQTSAAHAILPAALFFLVPVFALMLVVRAVVDRPLKRRHGRSVRAYTAYAMLTLLTLLGALAGALPLSQALAGHNSNGEVDGKRTGEVVQALIGLLVGVAVLHLAPSAGPRERVRAACGKLYTFALVIVLCSATLLALLAPFLSSVTSSPQPQPRIPLALPPALFLAYTLLALPRVLFPLIHHHLRAHPPTIAPDAAYTPARARAPTAAAAPRPSPAYNLDFGYDPAAPRASSATTAPFPFPYPPRTHAALARGPPAWLLPAPPASPRRGLRAQVSFPALRAHPGRGSGSVKLPLQSRGGGGSTTPSPGTTRRPITIHVATQRTSWAYPGEDVDFHITGDAGGVRVCLPSPSASSSEESHEHGRRRSGAGKVGVDGDGSAMAVALPAGAFVYPPRRGSASTVGTATDSEVDAKGLGMGLGLGVPPPPLTPIESDVEVLPYRRSVDGEGGGEDGGWESSEESGRAPAAAAGGGRSAAARYKELERGRFRGITIVGGAPRGEGSSDNDSVDGSGARTRAVLVWALAAQLAALGGWACALGLGVVEGAGEGLAVVRAVFVVLAAVGTMQTYFGADDTFGPDSSA